MHVPAAGTAAPVTASPRRLELRYGRLRECALAATRLLPAAAAAAFPGTGFEVTGQSCLRSLTSPDTAGWALASSGRKTWHTPTEDVALVELRLMLESTTMTDPLAWVEQITWTDGPPVPAVEEVLTAAACYVGCGDGIGYPGRAYPTHFAKRLYSAAAFALYALAQDERGRRVLTERNTPPLPAARLGGKVAFEGAHAWLRPVDLSWLRPGHPAHELLDTYVRLLAPCIRDIVDPEHAHAGIAAGLLDAAVGILTAPAGA